MMIKILEAKPVDDFRLRLEFSDAAIGIFDGRELLAKSGPLLEPLRDPAYFSRAFVDAGGLCWPNGLELSPQRLRAMVTVEEPHPV